MERMIFREEQSFRQSFMPWIILPAWLFTVGIFVMGLYQQLYQGMPFGDNPMSNNGLLWSGILSVSLLSAVFILLMSVNLVTEVWSDGIRYKFPPFVPKMKHILLADISAMEVGKYNPVLEFGGWGWRKRFIQRKTAYNISGNKGLRVTRKDGSQIMFGTRKQEEMQRAIDKMKQGNTNKNSF